MTKDAEELRERIYACFVERGLTLSVAESCTGGLVCDCITDRAGASAFLVAGVVAYSRRAKEDLAGVDAGLLDRCGMVSRETAMAMAEGVRRLAGTDWAVSTTGNLGPDALEGKQMGLVYVAVSGDTRTVAAELHLKGGRRQNKEDAVTAALRLLADTAAGTPRGQGVPL